MLNVSGTQEMKRNEPCPCGSKKKYKRCCGKPAQSNNPIPVKMEEIASGMPSQMPDFSKMDPSQLGGMDPSSIDPQWMMQFSQAMRKLPKGQMQRFQSLMQKAMAGKDVTREAEELEKILPPELQEMMKNAPAGMLPGAEGDEPAPNMSPEEARKIVEDAAKAGTLSQEKANELLAAPEKKKGFFKKLFK